MKRKFFALLLSATLLMGLLPTAALAEDADEMYLGTRGSPSGIL